MFSIPFLLLTIVSSDVLGFADAAPSFRFLDNSEPVAVATLPKAICIYIYIYIEREREREREKERERERETER
jgi:hypothetical protein